MDRVHSGSPYEGRYGFCRARRVGDRVLVAGTAPIEPDGSAASSAYGQMMRCADIAVAAMTELGASPDDVVLTRMFITDANDADEVGRAHQQCFGAAEPVATMVVVGGLLDSSWKVELEVEAVVGAR